MALSYAHGSQLWAAADAATTNYVISGVGFTPKAIMVWTNGQTSSTDAVTSATNARVNIGFCASTTNRYCNAILDVDAAAAADTQEIYRTDAVVASVSAAGAMDGLLDISAIGADGFTFTVDDQIPADIRVFWCAWGGADITNAEVIAIAEPAATGNQDYVLAGAFQGDAVLLTGTQIVSATDVNDAEIQDAGLMFGAATGPSNQYVVAINSDEGSLNADLDIYARSDKCAAMVVVAGGNPNAEAAFVQWNSNGFRLNWTARGLTNRRYLALVIKGGQWAAGAYTLNAQTTGNTATVSGLAFQPVGALSATHGQTQSTAATSQSGTSFGLGCWSSPSSRRTVIFGGADAAANMDIALGIDYDSIHIFVSGGAIVVAVDLDVVNADGFRVIVDLGFAPASTTVLFGYLTFGDAAAGPAFMAAEPFIVRQAVNRGATY